MEQEKEDGHGAIVEIHAPAGFWGKVTGLTAHDFFLFVIVLMLGVLIFMVQKSDSDRERRYADLQQQLSAIAASDKTTISNQMVILRAVADVAEEQKATTYVLTLNQKQREALKLQEPKSIRDRISR